MDAKTLTYYDSQSATVGARYRVVVGGVSEWFVKAFSGFAKVLDVGCGSGRDLCILLSQGHDAAGADSSRGMLAVATETLQRQAFNPVGRLVQDGLPDLASFSDGSFDGVLCSAVLMHLPEERLFDSVYGIRRVLRSGGRLLLSIPATRTDVDPVTRRDPHGRYYADLWNLLPAHPSVNNAKRDSLPSQPLLRRRRDAVIGYWEKLRDAVSDRFDREASGLCGSSLLERDNWQIPLFSRLAEAVEITAVQRCVPRWDPAAPRSVNATRASTRGRRVISTPRPLHQDDVKSSVGGFPDHSPPQVGPQIHDYADIRDQAFVRYLPIVGALAAGVPVSGFDVSDLESANECQWIAVPERLAGRNRFVVRIAGDSMEPELAVGDWVVFEYHRTPRAPNQIVIANITELGITSDLATDHAVKRLIQSRDHWIFRSTNPRYRDNQVAKTDCLYPILGIMVAKL